MGRNFKATRVNEDDPVQAWIKHDQNLHEKVDHLNERHYATLHYQAKGTDLTIKSPKSMFGQARAAVNESGHEFMANMPTEEVFTRRKDGVDGVVSSTKPLSYGGNIIENFTLTFENGRIVDIKAEKGEDILKELVETDEGSHYLGEVALVPYDSPISQSNILSITHCLMKMRQIIWRSAMPMPLTLKAESRCLVRSLSKKA